MTKSNFFLMIPVLFVLTIAGTVRGQLDDFGAPLRKAVTDYDKAWNSKDGKVVREMLDDGYVYFSSVGTLSNKKSTLDFLGKPNYKLTFVERSEMVVHYYDGKVAVISSRWQGKGSWSGGEINDDQRCGQTWIKNGGKWKMLSEHCVQIANK